VVEGRHVRWKCDPMQLRAANSGHIPCAGDGRPQGGPDCICGGPLGQSRFLQRGAREALATRGGPWRARVRKGQSRAPPASSSRQGFTTSQSQPTSRLGASVAADSSQPCPPHDDPITSPLYWTGSPRDGGPAACAQLAVQRPDQRTPRKTAPRRIDLTECLGVP
jgi:hypothetical protein